MKYLINTVETYRVDSMEEVERLQEECKKSGQYELSTFTYKAKEVKSKGEVIDAYWLCQVKKIFANEKEPSGCLEVVYQEA